MHIKYIFFKICLKREKGDVTKMHCFQVLVLETGTNVSSQHKWVMFFPSGVWWWMKKGWGQTIGWGHYFVVVQSRANSAFYPQQGSKWVPAKEQWECSAAGKVTVSQTVMAVEGVWSPHVYTPVGSVTIAVTHAERHEIWSRVALRCVCLNRSWMCA